MKKCCGAVWISRKQRSSELVAQIAAVVALRILFIFAQVPPDTSALDHGLNIRSVSFLALKSLAKLV